MDFGLCWHQPDDPNPTGTLMVCVASQVAPPGASRQTASLVRWTARASHPWARPDANVTVPGGSAGSGRHAPVAPMMVSPRPPVSTIATAPPGPNDAEVSLAL
jgi:hypothetical protein